MDFIATNQFNGGMDKDTLKSILPKNKYTDARNKRLITDKGQSSGALENTLGNTLFKQIPDTYKVYKITVANAPAGGGTTITINGNTIGPLTITSSTDGQTLWGSISGMIGYGTTFSAAYATTYVLVWGLSQDPIITFGGVNPADLISTLYINNQSTLEPIGWCKLRDTIILFTTNDTSVNGGVGQIWKVTYNKNTIFSNPSTSAIFTLLYNNNLNFTKRHPIPKDGATEGRYENSSTQRIYWTDNFNQLRVFNTSDPQGFAIDPTLLSINPSMSMSIPVLQKINDTGGSLLVGAYQTSYRLKNNGGATTTFLPASNTVKILASNSTAPFRDQAGAGINSTTTKSITWKISNLDTNFDRLEIASVFWDSVNSTVPIINIIYDEPVPSNGIFTFTFTGNELNPIPISLDEYLAPTGAFTQCKTIASKDNRLFAGNTKNTKFDITFDARSLRFNNAITPVAKISNADLTTGIVNVAINFSNLPAEGTNDAVNFDPSIYKFQSNGVTIGGSGPNIDYYFEAFTNGNSTFADAVDVADRVAITVAGGPIGVGNEMGKNYRFTNQQGGNYTVNGVVYPGNNFYTEAISPYLESIYKGYRHEEIYRFGIVFFDKQGNSSPVKWIGDINCPKVFDTDGNGAAVDFGISATSVKSQYVKILHPIFTVRTGNISTTDQAKIGGFSIVRVPRTSDDKTILYSGIITPVEYDGTANNYLPEVSAVAGDSAFGNLGNAESTNTGGGGISVNNRNLCIFISPDHLLGSFTPFQTGDKLIITSKLDAPAANFKDSNATGKDFHIEKLYTHTNTTDQNISIIDTHNLIRGEQSVALNGNVFNNNTYDGTHTFSEGENGILIACAAIDYTTAGLTKANSGKFYAHYKRTLAAQYGGRTFSQRSTNEYYSCNHFQKLTSTTFTTYTISLFGGDTLTTIMDNQRYIKNWIGINGASPTKVSYFNFFPCEIDRNCEWRALHTINRTGMLDNGTGVDLGEDYNLNDVYDTIDHPIQLYFPLPAVFNQTTEFDNRVYYSQIKINGELSDSWGIFKPNNYWDVEGIYGPINNMLILQDRLLFWQDNSFGTLEINPRAVIQDLTGTSLQLGTGNVVQRHDYISVEAGAKHQWGMARSNSSVIFYDIIRKRMWKFTLGQGIIPLSDIKGLEAYLYNNTNGNLYDSDNPVYSVSYGGNIVGISATYDYRYNTYYFSFQDYKTYHTPSGDVQLPNSFTITYNELFNCYESFHDFIASMYINDGQIILTRDPSNVNNLYIHDIGNYGSFYGITYTSTIQIIINDHPVKTKVFDNLMIITESIDRSTTTVGINKNDDTWNVIRCYDDYQNTDFQNLIVNTNIKRKERTWQLPIPRNRVLYTSSNSPNIFSDLSITDKSFGERIRDKYMYIDLKYNNSNNYNLITHSISTQLRISDR